MTLFLGLDSSTQALKASLLDGDLNVVAEVEVRFDSDLPQYGTLGGTILGPDGSGVVYSPVLLLVEAIDLLFVKIQAASWPLHDVCGVSAAGQQHASVFWSDDAARLLSGVDADLPLAGQLQAAFSRDEVPNWQDSSTLAECNLLEERMGGPSKLAHLTGSRAHTRFTGPQIMRFKQMQPEAYQKTARISLVSSFMTTMLCLDGEIKGIDESDACGMNMYNMSSEERGWDKEALEAVAGSRFDADELEAKLGTVERDGGRVVGHIGKWYVKRYGFSPRCIVCPGTGDNPATFLSFALQEGEGLISLGTSDTVLVSTSTYRPDPEYHAFLHPAQTAGQSARYFNMLVYKNGSLAREHVRDKYFASSWEHFDRAVESSRPKGSIDLRSQTGFWWLKPEIIPADASGVHKYVTTSQGTTEKVDEFQDKSSNAVAILESQMLSYRSRSSAIMGIKGDDAKLKRVFAAGGAASNATICSIMADVMGCDVCKQVTFDEMRGVWKNADWNACSVAAAYKAAWSWARHTAEGEADDQRISFDSFISRCSHARQRKRGAAEGTQVQEGMELLKDGIAMVARLDVDRAQAYDGSIDWWKKAEALALQASRLKHNNGIQHRLQ